DTRCALDPFSAPVGYNDLAAGCDYAGTGADVAGDGPHVIYAASEDPNGNDETPVSASFKIDKSAPTTAIDVSPATPDGDNDWYKTTVGLAISGDDGSGSGIAETRCALDPASVPASFDDLPAGACGLTSVSANGAHSVYAASEDSAGNQSALGNAAFKVDRTA